MWTSCDGMRLKKIPFCSLQRMEFYTWNFVETLEVKWQKQTIRNLRYILAMKLKVTIYESAKRD